jgi:hypothetical protein
MINPPFEPLGESAPQARRLAPSLCRKDPATGTDCSWYHGLWQDLRLIGLAASPEHQPTFFLDTFQEIATKLPRPRVLISGAADYSILAYVLWACRENGLEPEVTVLDRCQTPLHFNTWYGERCGVNIHAVHADILDHVSDCAFDIICSHSFVGQFRAEHRPALVKKWWDFLTPGGAVMAINRVRPPGGATVVSFTREEAEKFRTVVAERSEGLDVASPEEYEEILRRTEVYAHTAHTYTVSEDDFLALFDDAGFQRENLVRIVSSDPKNRNIEGKAIPKNATHACLIARRPIAI